MRITMLMSAALLGASLAAANAQTTGAAGPAPADQYNGVPPTSAYRGGAGSPFSNRASNITGNDTRSVIAPRLPNPDTTGDSPRDFLVAAQRALAAHQTGAAQEALERAQTRILTRSTDPSMANAPDNAADEPGDRRRPSGAGAEQHPGCPPGDRDGEATVLRCAVVQQRRPARPDPSGGHLTAAPACETIGSPAASGRHDRERRPA